MKFRKEKALSNLLQASSSSLATKIKWENGQKSKSKYGRIFAELFKFEKIRISHLDLHLDPVKLVSGLHRSVRLIHVIIEFNQKLIFFAL